MEAELDIEAADAGRGGLTLDVADTVDVDDARDGVGEEARELFELPAPCAFCWACKAWAMR